jgi:hypothetical protein
MRRSPLPATKKLVFIVLVGCSSSPKPPKKKELLRTAMQSHVAFDRASIYFRSSPVHAAYKGAVPATYENHKSFGCEDLSHKAMQIHSVLLFADSYCCLLRVFKLRIFARSSHAVPSRCWVSKLGGLCTEIGAGASYEFLRTGEKATPGNNHANEAIENKTMMFEQPPKATRGKKRASKAMEDASAISVITKKVMRSARQ